jgi:hypothetical protein
MSQQDSASEIACSGWHKVQRNGIMLVTQAVQTKITKKNMPFLQEKKAVAKTG